MNPNFSSLENLKLLTALGEKGEHVATDMHKTHPGYDETEIIKTVLKIPESAGIGFIIRLSFLCVDESVRMSLI